MLIAGPAGLVLLDKTCELVYHVPLMGTNVPINFTHRIVYVSRWLYMHLENQLPLLDLQIQVILQRDWSDDAA